MLVHAAAVFLFLFQAVGISAQVDVGQEFMNSLEGVRGSYRREAAQLENMGYTGIVIYLSVTFSLFSFFLRQLFFVSKSHSLNSFFLLSAVLFLTAVIPTLCLM